MSSSFGICPDADLPQLAVTSDNTFRRMIDALPDAVLIHSKQAIVFANPACVRLLAAENQEQLIGKHISEIIHPDYLPSIQERIQRNYECQRLSPPAEQVLVALDGSSVQVETVASPFTWEGAPAIQVALRDIKERKHQQAAMQEWHQRLELAQKAGLRIGFWEWDMDSDAVACSDETRRQFGLTNDEDGYAAFFSRIHPADRQRVEESAQEALAGIPDYAIQYRVTQPDGTTSWIESRGVNVTNGSRRMIGISVDITDLKMSEKRLRESEERWRLLLNSTAEGIFGIDLNGLCTFCNPEAARMLGYADPDELIGKCVQPLHCHRHFDREYPGADCSVCQNFLRPEGVHVDNDVFFKADGSRFPIEYWSHPMRVGTEMVGAVVTFLDISTRKQAEQALRSSEEKYRLLFDRNPHPMWVYDKTSLAFLAVNQSAIDHYGYSRAEFFAMTLRDIRPTEDIPVFELNIFSRNNEINRAGVWRHRVRDGRVIYVDITDCDLVFEGRPAGLVLANDITEKKHAEDALIESEAKHRELVENSPFGIYRMTPEGKLLDANAAMAALLGYSSPQELLALSFDKDVFVDPGERPAFHSRCAATGRVSEVVNWKRKDQKVIVVRLCGRAVASAKGDVLHFEVIAEDITEKRLLEQQLRQAQKMEAVGRLAGGVAHDFNNILGVIIGYSDLLLTDSPMNSRSKQYLHEIKKAGHRAADLTHQLLAFSRQQVLEPRTFELNHAVREVRQMLLRVLGEDIDLTTCLSPNAGCIKADPTQIHQVILNLAVNARDAMPGGGKLIIETDKVHLEQSFCERHPGSAAGEYSVFAVRDTGIGMSKTVQARIFEPFFTTKAEGKGTGLGLATVYGIVKQSGGYISVDSEVGVGTTFKVYLPSAAPRSGLDHTVQEPAAVLTGTETVLLVEDEPSLRELNAELLKSVGYTVVPAGDGTEALELAETYPGIIDLLLTDVIMPRMNGRELVEKLTGSRPRLKVVYMSGYTDNLVLQQALSEPGRAFLQKPFTRQALERKIREVLGRSVGM